jgi:hypothetical protein
VFGAGSPRLVKVLSGQSDNAWLVGVHLDQIKKAGQWPSVYAIAPYFSTDVNVAPSIPTLRTAMQGVTAEIGDCCKAVLAAGLPLISYEGGQELYSAGADVVNRDPAMHQIYLDFLAQLVALGFSEVVLYLHVFPYSSTNAFGHVERLGQTPTPPKYQACLDWIAANA